MADGVIDSTIEEAKAHPWLVVGGFVALAALLWYLSGPKATAPQSFQFSYGPSDAQVKAGTALSIAQAGNQAALSAAQIGATTQEHVYDSYFGYLTNAGNNAATQAATVASYAFQTAQAADSANVEINRANNVTNSHVADLAYGSQNYIADLNYIGNAHAEDLTYYDSIQKTDAQKYIATLNYYGNAHKEELDQNYRWQQLFTPGAPA